MSLSSCYLCIRAGDKMNAITYKDEVIVLTNMRINICVTLLVSLHKAPFMSALLHYVVATGMTLRCTITPQPWITCANKLEECKGVCLWIMHCQQHDALCHCPFECHIAAHTNMELESHRFNFPSYEYLWQGDLAEEMRISYTIIVHEYKHYFLSDEI